jgi:hypothetical protein
MRPIEKRRGPVLGTPGRIFGQHNDVVVRSGLRGRFIARPGRESYSAVPSRRAEAGAADEPA